MANWKLNGTEVEPAGWDITRVRRGAPWEDSAYLVANDNYNGTALVAFGDVCTITHPDGTVLLVGYAEPLTRGATIQESRSFRVVGLWSRLAELPYREKFKAAQYGEEDEDGNLPIEYVDYWRSKTHLGTDDAGAPLSASATVAKVLAFAADQCAVPVSMGAGFTGFAPPPQEFEGMCSEAIQRILRANPDVFPYMVYADGAGTLNFKTSGALTETTVAMADATATVQVVGVPAITRRDDLQATGVVFTLERVGQFNGIGLIEIKEDKFPSGANKFDPRCLSFTLAIDSKVDGSAPDKQSIRTRKLPKEEDSESVKAKWLAAKLPGLKYYLDEGIITLGDIEVKDYKSRVIPPNGDWADSPDDPDDPEPLEWSTDVADYPRELVEGDIQYWMTGIKRAPVVVVAQVGLKTAPTDARLKKIFGEKGEVKHEASIRCTGTDALTKVYSGLPDFGVVQAWPEYNVAEAYYNQVSTAPFDGEIILTHEASINPPTSVAMGAKLNVSGGLSAWATMAAPVYSIDYNATNGFTTLRVGPPRTLPFQDMVERQRFMRRIEPVSGSAERKAEARPGDGLGGSSLGFTKPSGEGGFMPVSIANPAFRLEARKDGETYKARLHPGSLFWQARTLDANPSDTPTAPTNKLQRFQPTFLSEALDEMKEADAGTFWLKWTTTENGTVDSAEVVTTDPGADTEYDPNEGTAGAYSIEIGTVASDGSVTQKLRSDAFWNGVALTPVGGGGSGSGGSSGTPPTTTDVYLVSSVDSASCTCSCGTDPGTGSGGGGTGSCSVTVAGQQVLLRVKTDDLISTGIVWSVGS